jgi:hypothetical protein
VTNATILEKVILHHCKVLLIFLGSLYRVSYFNSTILQVGSMHFTAKLPEGSRKRNAKRLSKEDICLPFIGHGLCVANLASTSSSYSGSVTGRELTVFVTNVI